MTDQNITNNQATQDVESRLEILMKKVEKDSEDFERASKETDDRLNEIEAKVDASVENVEKLSADLDEAEKEAEDELDQIILEQAEDLASEE